MLNAKTGEVVRQINDDWSLHFLAFSPDSQFLATSESRTHVGGPDERRVRVLDAGTLAERCRYLEITHGGWSEDLSFNSDAGWVAGRAGPFGPFGEITPMAYVFDAANGTQRWQRHYPNIYCLALAPDSGSLAVGYDEVPGGGPSTEDENDRGIAVLDSATGAERRRIRTTPTRVHSVAYSPDSRRIIAGCQDGTVRVYDAADGSIQATTAAHGGPVVSVAVSDDGRWVAANCVANNPELRGLVGIFDVVRGTPRFPPVQVQYFEEVRYSPTLRHVIVLSKFGWSDPFGPEFGLTAIDARTGGRHSGSADAIKRFAMAPDGGSIAALIEVPSDHISGRDEFADLYDLGIAVSRHEVGSGLTALAMSPAGTPLVAVADTDSAVTIIDATSGTRLARKPIPGTVASIVFADHGQAVAVGGSDGVRLFSIVGTRSWKVDTIGKVNALAVAGEAAEWIATAADRTVRLLSSADGTSCWPSPNTHPQTVTRIAASSDGKWIATGCVDRKTRVLDAHRDRDLPHRGRRESPGPCVHTERDAARDRERRRQCRPRRHRDRVRARPLDAPLRVFADRGQFRRGAAGRRVGRQYRFHLRPHHRQLPRQSCERSPAPPRFRGWRSTPPNTPSRSPPQALPSSCTTPATGSNWSGSCSRHR